MLSKKKRKQEMARRQEVDIFGNTDPKFMPRGFFYGALYLDFNKVIEADISKQNFNICPRFWYIDAVFLCRDLKIEFTWTAQEQKVWFEEYGFYVDALPVRCKQARQDRRRAKIAKQTYDQIVGEARETDNLELKAKVMALIEEMSVTQQGLPEKYVETYRIFQKQIKKSGKAILPDDHTLLRYKEM